LTFSSNNQGSGNGTIYISFSENTTTSDRYGNIIVSTNEAHPYLDDIEIAILQYQYGENAIYVSPNGSIQNAIDSVLPGEAKIIFVYPGIYAENLVIDNWLGSRQIKLSSIGDALDTILKMDDGCANSILRVIGCGTDLIRIEGFTFRGGTEGSEIGVISEEGVLGGGAISIQESYVNISNCVITDNEADGYGGAIFIRDSELNMNNVTIFDNQLSETARVDGGGIYIYGDSQVNMLNSIMYDNTPNDIASHNDAGQIVDIDYSMINIVDTGQTGLSLYQCIEGYPVICTYSDDDVNLVGCIMEGSPCIDAGRGNLYDEDCTTSDMGAIPTVVDVKVCEGDHWNWESFPRVGELQTDISDNISDILDADDLYPLYEYNPGIQINSQTQVGFTVFTGDVWDPERTIYSAVGYKVNRDDDENFYVPLEGYRLCNNYQFNLTANEDKWLGYWIPETRNIVDAFNDLWSHVKTIYAEDWCYKRPINGLSTPSSVTTGKNLEYGKMYIVTTDISTTYTWDPPGGGGPGQNSERETPKYFYFADQPDYLAVDVLDIPQGIEEIGVFQGTTCIGASVVESESEQILAYVDPELRDEYELSFQLISEDRSRIVIDNCWVYDENNGEFDKDQIKIDSDGYILLSFKVDYPDGNCPIPGCYLYQNYPNPFNPETNIRFYLSSETSGAELTIYNIRGQEVKNYDLVSYKGGREHEVTWNGINNAGTKVSSGIYFCRLSSDQGSVSNKMVLIK
jgi:hypothetical protein